MRACNEVCIVASVFLLLAIAQSHGQTHSSVKDGSSALPDDNIVDLELNATLWDGDGVPNPFTGPSLGLIEPDSVAADDDMEGREFYDFEETNLRISHTLGQCSGSKVAFGTDVSIGPSTPAYDAPPRPNRNDALTPGLDQKEFQRLEIALGLVLNNNSSLDTIPEPGALLLLGIGGALLYVRKQLFPY